MRVLLTHNYYSITGGAEVFFHEIGRLLEQNGHQVAKFACAEDDLNVPYAEHFPEVEHYADGGLLSKIRRVPSVIYNRDARDGFAKTIAEFEPDIVHGFAIYGRLTPAIFDAAKASNIPTIVSCNDYKHICPNYKLFHHGRLCEDCKGGAFYNAIRNRCAHDSLAVSAVSALEAYVHDHLNLWRGRIDRFLFASQFMAHKTLEFWGEGAVNTDILQNPFDAQKHFVEAHAGSSILYFGRLIEEKGVTALLAAARLAPEVPFVIVGDGPDRPFIEDAAAKLENVTFVGPVWGDALKPYLHAARAVVVPSLWHENFPYVIFQAFAAGTPVLGARRGGIPELVTAGPHGWLFDPLDPDELAHAAKTVQGLPDEKIVSMGCAAQDYVAQTFSDEAIYASLERIYNEVID
ncbi:MAG: glycosyltransferase [Pseudomonadota bacterium]